jgi:hypothetical protein
MRGSTAFILVEIATRASVVSFGFKLCWMVQAIPHFSYLEVILASTALEYIKVGPDLPVDFFPRNAISFPHISDELLEVPFFVNDMLCSFLTMEVYISFTLSTAEIWSLSLGEQLEAISALMKIILFFFK